MDELRDLYQTVIIDHNKSPRNFGVLEGANREADGDNPLCGDKLHIQLKLDADDLYREETFTDRRIGTLRRLTPVTKEGDDDPSRAVMFIGQAQLWTQMGPLPINFELETPTLEAALKAFPDAARVALEQTMEEAREMRRQQASQIVVPGQSPGGIQMP